jgi:ATP-dependent phosphofructokinase / diphosphate-dependent phosphofructokinase
VDPASRKPSPPPLPGATRLPGPSFRIRAWFRVRGRSAPPIPFDIEYTRDLGYSAVDYLKRVEGDESGAMITIQEGHMVPLPFGSFSDPETERVRIRLLNPESSSYRVAREYMIRLDREDLDDPDKLRPIAEAAGLTPQAFRDRYGYLTEG